MDLNESLGILVQEARELLADMEVALLAIEAHGVEPDRINALFRAAHTIKGSAGLFGLDPIVSFTHLMESLLVDVRSGELALEPELAGLMFNCADHLGSLIDCLEAGGDLSACEPDLRMVLMDSLRDYWQAECPAAAAAPALLAGSTDARTWQIQLRFAPDLLAQGMDPQSFLLYLTNLGELLSINTGTETLPALAEMDPEICYLTFDLELLTAASEAEIAATFDFARDGSDIRIRCLDEPAASAVAQVPAPTGKTVINTGTGNTGTSPRNGRESSLIKVDSRKLDELIDAVGELVIRSASCHAHPVIRGNSALAELMESVGGLVEQIRDRALNMRMVPIGEVFQRFPRVVRDVCQELGKRIDLQISGADTELDKSMVEKLTDPLLHIVRNAMDHGIEPVADRVAAGKPEQGILRLNAYHQSGAVVIEISDDGRGLDTAKILRKAVERGLVAPEAKLTERDIFNLIFAAGFSTADQVTDLSGRGVGMDVVRQNIEQLRGSIDIQSTKGAGTRFHIQLPLTLAIIDGFEVAVGDSHFVLPLDMVVECLEFSASTGNDIFNLRGQPLPYLRLAQQFGIDSTPEGRECLVVLQCGEQRAGLVVDRFVGELQAVIKPLGHLLGSMRGFSGSTILGDGSVALLLDIPALVARAARSATQPLSLHGAT
ncbi:MAG: chemotaxis protein CheA [Gammaproteobacteria bacterium]|nr:chemotaxis protein CheA [Gammaproteobacteria bacterium]